MNTIQRSEVAKPQMIPCPSCNGTGARPDCYASQKRHADKMGKPVVVTCACCNSCNGTGWRLATAQPMCPKCNRLKLPLGVTPTPAMLSLFCCPIQDFESWHPDRSPECGSYHSDPLATDEWRT